MLEIILCYLVLFLCLFVDYPKKKKNYKGLKFTKLEFHITYFYVSVYLSIIPKNKKKEKKKKQSCKELELGELKYLRKTLPSILFTKNSSLYAWVPY